MNIVVLAYRRGAAGGEAFLARVDPFAGRVLWRHPVPISPNLGVFHDQDRVLVSYAEARNGAPLRNWLDVYRLAEGVRLSRLAVEWRAHFNVCPSWSTFLSSPDRALIYVYEARTLGHHWAEDFIWGLDPVTMARSTWTFKIPGCVAGWSAAGGRAHAQMLFMSDGLEVGRLPTTDLDQKVGFWLGPDGGMGPIISLGPRPRLHSKPGHARAILTAPGRPLSVVVCDNGLTHLIDPVEFRYLGRQSVQFTPGQSMPLFAAQVDPQGRLLYVGTAAGEARCQGIVERVVVHSLEYNRRQLEWVLEEPFSHMALSEDGRHLCGAGAESNRLWVLDARSGRAEAVMPLDGSPRYVIPVC